MLMWPQFPRQSSLRLDGGRARPQRRSPPHFSEWQTARAWPWLLVLMLRQLQVQTLPRPWHTIFSLRSAPEKCVVIATAQAGHHPSVCCLLEVHIWDSAVAVSHGTKITVGTLLFVFKFILHIHRIPFPTFNCDWC